MRERGVEDAARGGEVGQEVGQEVGWVAGLGGLVGAMGAMGIKRRTIPCLERLLEVVTWAYR